MRAIVPLLFAIALVSCQDEDSPATHTHGHESHSTAEPEPGARWTADAQTTRHVHAMLEQASKAADAGADPASTAASLRATYQQIFRDCTMEGAAHEQLHTFLLPIAPLLDRLDAGDRVALTELVAHLRDYDQRFQ